MPDIRRLVAGDNVEFEDDPKSQTLTVKVPLTLVARLADLANGVAGSKGPGMLGWGDGANYPAGSLGRRMLDLIASVAAVVVGQGSGIIGNATYAGLSADLAHGANTVGFVSNDPTAALNGFYLKQGASGSGSWVAATQSALDVKINARGVFTEDVLSWGIIDAAGNVAIGVQYDGTLVAKLPVTTDAKGAANGLSIDRQADGGYFLSLGSAPGVLEFEGAALDLNEKPESDALYVINDSAGNVVLALMRDGTFYVPKLTSSSIKPDPTVRREPTLGTRHLDINHFMVSGQSLSVAGSSASVIDANDFMLSTGLHAATGSTNTLAPLSNTNSDGVLFAAAGQLKFLCAGNAGYTADDRYAQDFRMLVSGHGVSGQSIANLSKGGVTGAYEQGMWQVDEGARLSASLGLSYGVQAMSWIQGESDSGTAVATYKSALIALKNDYNTDVLAKTGQRHRFKLWCFQTGSEQFWGSAGVEYEPRAAAATLEAAEADDEIMVVSPTYWVYHRDGVHFESAGYTLFGEMWGKVLYKAVYRGEDWRPLRPIDIYAITPRVVIAKFHVPEPPLVFDTVTVANPGNMGFVVRDASGDAPIADVSIVNRDTVRITLSRDLAASPLLTYAWYSTGGTLGGPTTGPRGCLRDSDPTIGAFDGAKLPNWCVRFKKIIN